MSALSPHVPTSREVPTQRRRDVTPPSGPHQGRAEGPGGARPRRGYELSKRALDVTVAVLFLLLLLPVMALIALAVRTTSRGPALFRQERVGRHCEPFVMLKFRSMRVDNDDAVHRAYVTALLTQEAPPDGGEAGVYKLARDPRVTRIGTFLRRTSMDELPQLFNVLKGEMSLVGPRPALAFEVQMYDSAQRRRLDVLPGLTGLWQVSGRSALTMREALHLDVDYVAQRTLWLDLRILLRTPLALLGSGRAR